MASKWYPIGLKNILQGAGVLNANLKMALINTGTTYNAAHDYYADIAAGVVGTPIALANEACSVSSNVIKFDADDTGLEWTVAAGSTIVAVVVYDDTGDPATDNLITWNDVDSTPTNGGTITITIHGDGIGTITC